MRRLTFLIFVVLLVFPMSVSAQQVIMIEDMVVQFWPEFDRPEMLVIYDIKLSDDTQFPITLSFRIPIEAGEPFVVADGEVGDNVVSERTVEGDWGVISFTTNSTLITIEYYDPKITIEDSTRNFTYTWPGDYLVNNMSLVIKQPLDADSLQATPQLDGSQREADGYLYSYKELNGISAGQVFEFTVEYEKQSDVLSQELEITQPSTANQPATAEPTTEPASSVNWLAIGLGVIGLAILGYGAFGLNRGESRQSGYKRPRGRSVSTGSGEAGGYCHNCGAKAKLGNNYCRECGTKLR